MKNAGLILLVVVGALVSVSQAEYLVNGGFETGDLTGWTQNAGGNHQVVSSFGAAITPRSGSFFDATNWRYDTNTLTQTIAGGAKQGVLTGYIYLEDLSYWPGFMISDGTNTVIAMIGYSSQYVGDDIIYLTRNGWGDTVPTGLPVTANVWHKMQYVADDSGLDFYWDDTLAMENWAPMTSISSVSVGGGWNTVPTGYDDFSFVPATPDLPTCAEVIEMGYGYDTDMNSDCYVNGIDLKQFIDEWLRCIDPAEVDCEKPWINPGTTAGAGAQTTLDVIADEVIAWADGFESGDLSGWNPGPVNAGWHTVGANMDSLLPQAGSFLATTSYDAAGSTDTTCVNIFPSALNGYTVTGYMAYDPCATQPAAVAQVIVRTSQGDNWGDYDLRVWIEATTGQIKYNFGGLPTCWSDNGYVAYADPFEWVKVSFYVDSANGGKIWINDQPVPVYSWWNGWWSPGRDIKSVHFGAGFWRDSNIPTAHAAYDGFKAYKPTPPPPPIMEVDGAPFFPLGYFDHFVDTTASGYDARYGPYSQQGVNTVLHWGSNWASGWEWSVMAADRALAHGLNYMAGIHTFAVWGHDNATPQNPVPLEALDVLVDHLWSHPALAGWYLCDEPDIAGVTPARLQAAYARVQARDLKPGDHPQLVVFSGGPQPYFAAEPPLSHDVTMYDSYPCNTANGGAEFSNLMHGVSVGTRNDRNLIKSYGNIKPQVNVAQAVEWDDGYHTPFRHPTYKEQRYLTFGPIVEGARGILWWDYGNPVDPAYISSRANYRQYTLGPVATQIRALIPAIISNDTSIAVTSDHDSDTGGRGIEDVTYLLGADSQHSYLLAVNHTNAAIASVTFTLTGASLGLADGASAVTIEVPFEELLDNVNYTFQSRFAAREPLSGYTWTITDSFGPYDVNIYRLGNATSPTNCSEALTYGYSLEADFNDDCHVNLQDFSLIAQDWLRCIQPDDVDCEKPWN